MKVTAEVKDLKAALKIVAACMVVKKTLPVLSAVVLEVKDGVALFRATDLENSVETKLKSTVEGDGLAVVEFALFKRLVDTAGKLKCKTVTLESLEGGGITVNGVEVQQFFPVEELPVIPGDAIQDRISVSAEVLKTAISKAVPFMSADTTRYALTGLCVDLGRNSLVTTDGHRLMVVALSFDGVTGLETLPEKDDQRTPGKLYRTSYIIPPPGVKALLAMLDKGEVEIGGLALTDATAFQFRLNGTRLVVRLLDAKFPDFEYVRRHDSPFRFTVSVAGLLEVVQQAMATAENPYKQMITFTQNEGTIDVVSFTNGRATVKRRLASTDNLPLWFSISASAKYLSDLLSLLVSETVTLECDDPICPMQIVSGSLEHVLMPMREDMAHRIGPDGSLVSQPRAAKKPAEEETEAPEAEAPAETPASEEVAAAAPVQEAVV